MIGLQLILLLPFVSAGIRTKTSETGLVDKGNARDTLFCEGNENVTPSLNLTSADEQCYTDRAFPPTCDTTADFYYAELPVSPRCFINRSSEGMSIIPGSPVRFRGKFVMNLSHSNLTSVPQNIPRNVTNLILSHNSLTEIPNGTFDNLFRLRTLDISFSRVFTVHQYSFFALRKLDLSNNDLKTIPKNFFTGMRMLRRLNISGNNITRWTSTISGLSELQYLDLSHNSLRELPMSLCRDLDKIQKSSPVSVDLAGNPLQCTCHEEFFAEWLTKTKVKFSNRETFCTLANGTVLPLIRFSRAISGHLHRDCRSSAVLIGGFCAGLGIFLTTLLFLVIYWHRWKLRYVYNMAFNWRQKMVYQTLDDAEENTFAFDAFVSYEDVHRNFIREMVIPRLETEKCLKLCVDKRDFIPGHYITDNILHAILNSKKTVVFLSRQFLKSKWCVFELNMARMEEIHKGRELLVVVLMEMIPREELTPELIEIFGKQSYLEMTDNLYGERIFWENLVRAITSR